MSSLSSWIIAGYRRTEQRLEHLSNVNTAITTAVTTMLSFSVLELSPRPELCSLYQDSDFQEMLECIHRNVAHSFRRTEIYAASFDTLTQCFLENEKFAREVSVRYGNKSQRKLIHKLSTPWLDSARGTYFRNLFKARRIAAAVCFCVIMAIVPEC